MTLPSKILARGCPAWVEVPVLSKSQAWNDLRITVYLINSSAAFYFLIKEIRAFGMSVILVKARISMELLESLPGSGNPSLGLTEESLIVFILGTFIGMMVVGFLDAEVHISQETLSDEVSVISSSY